MTVHLYFSFFQKMAEHLELLEEEALDIELEEHDSWAMGYDVSGNNAPPRLKANKRKDSSSRRKRQQDRWVEEEKEARPSKRPCSGGGALPDLAVREEMQIKVEVKQEPAENEEIIAPSPQGMIKRGLGVEKLIVLQFFST